MQSLKILDRNKKRRRKSRSLEYIFYREHENYLRKYPYFNKYFDSSHQFALLQSNIIIRGLMNKEIIDEAINNYKKSCLENNKKPVANELKNVVNDAIRDLPYINDEHNHRIYLPFFTKALNVIYVDEPIRLLSYPYANLLEDFSSSIIDAFETYNYSLYDSYFSKMIRSCGDQTSWAFFNVDDYCIYVINSQGRLDACIATYDKYLANFDVRFVMERVNKVMEKFFHSSRLEFIKALYDEKFISGHTYRKLLG